MSFASDLLPTLDDIRAIPGELGLHPIRVTRILKTWPSVRGQGTPTSTETVLLVGGQNPHVRESTDDAIRQLFGSMTTQFREGEWLVGPVTPNFDAGGYDPAGFDITLATQEIFYKLDQGTFGSTGMLFRARTSKKDSPLRITLVLEPIAKVGSR